MITSRLLVSFVAILSVALPLCGQMQQAAPANPITTDTRGTWDYMKSMVLAAAEQMPEENYSFKPVPEVRSFGEILAHIAQAQNMICAGVKGGEAPKAQLDKAGKAQLIAALNESNTFCAAAFDAVNDANAATQVKVFGRNRSQVSAIGMAAFHGFEHYGNLVTYMRIKGLVPPSSKK